MLKMHLNSHYKESVCVSVFRLIVNSVRLIGTVLTTVGLYWHSLPKPIPISTTTLPHTHTHICPLHTHTCAPPPHLHTLTINGGLPGQNDHDQL